MIPELDQCVRIASLECVPVKIPCPREVFLSNLGASRMNFIAHLTASRLGTFCFLFLPAISLGVTLVQKDPPARFADAPMLIWDIDLTLARALPRNFRTIDDQLQASDSKTYL
jgi:hypothetical protein